jgi:phosphodiesterase/alkaline phosphatase D-like protein
MSQHAPIDAVPDALPTTPSARKKVGFLLFCATMLLALFVLTMAGWSAVAARDLRQGIPTLPPPNVLPNGVAAGDVDQASAVLWARSSFPGLITFTYLITPGGEALAVTQLVTDVNRPAKVAIAGLTANARYVYTATTSEGQVGSGTFQTPAEVGTSTGLRIGASGDWRGELRPYPAIANAPARDLNLFLKLGDTIYADYPSPAVPLTQTVTITDFRKKHNEVYGMLHSRNIWAELQASTSILAMIDDHEVSNNFAGAADAALDPRFPETTGLINDTALYETGIQAFREYNPISSGVYSTTGDVRTDGEVDLYRYRTYGSDAAIFLLDARSFRDAPITPINAQNPFGDLQRFISDSFQPGRTLLSPRQLQQLQTDLLAAQQNGITWKFVAVPQPLQLLGPAGAEDRFEGYAAERTALLDFIMQNAIENVVFVAADYHGTIVNNLNYRANAATTTYTETSSFEITTGSVAFDAPFGPTAVEIGVAAGLIPTAQKAVYDALPVNNDADNVVNDKDDFVKSYLHQQYDLLGYDRIGLDGSSINAELLQGDYLAVHTYGWTEFAIAPDTQVLTVTTYGIPPYTQTDMTTMPSELLTQTQQIVSQFRVVPQVSANQLFLPLIVKQPGTTRAQRDLLFNIAVVSQCERQPAGNWFEGITYVEGQPSNGHRVVFSHEADGTWATAPMISGPHPGYEGWSTGYYSHIINAAGPQPGDWYVWIVNEGGERISELAQWTSTGPGEGCNQATVSFDSRSAGR